MHHQIHNILVVAQVSLFDVWGGLAMGVITKRQESLGAILETGYHTTF